LNNYNIEFLNEVDSTNFYLKKSIQKRGLSAPYCVNAGSQTAGRGQRSRVWDSQPFKNVLASFLVDNFGHLSTLPQLNNAATLAILDTLTEFKVNDIKIKWPNDVYIGSKKIAGILIENIVSHQEVKKAVVGMGINVNQKHFDKFEATSVINELGYSVSVIEFLQVLYNHFYSHITKDKRLLNQSVNEKLYKKGEMVTFKENEKQQPYIVNHICLNGNLQVSAMGKHFELEHHKVKWIK
jgi:BirA family biotin operon repressor/biotin-[acetyl-CoA-carboxylase] ligase